jgi:hypothetical protein
MVARVVGQHGGMIDRQIAALLEFDPVQLAGRVEHALPQHVLELEVGFHLRLIEVEARRAQLLGVERPVPGPQCE